MKNILGFIGTGNMGSALAQAAAKSGLGDILLANRTPEKAGNLARSLSDANPGLSVRAVDNAEAALRANYLFLGVKPRMMAGMLNKIAPVLAARSDRFVLVSMAAGLSAGSVRKMAGGNYPVVRIMPNTPAAVGAGVILYAADAAVTEEETRILLDVLAPAGMAVPLAENLFDAGAALSGSGPAFADLFMEALADGGVQCGLPRAVALMLAARTLYGSAGLALETGTHPGVLKDAVCSPGGSTIEGVAALERGAFRGTVMQAVAAACEKNAKMGKIAEDPGEKAGRA